MHHGAVSPDVSGSFGLTVAAHGLADCYQCGKCTAGCPVAARMDLAPNRVVRLAQLGETDTVLRSRAIWECVSCQTCSARCPKEVDCAALMDELREAALALDAIPRDARPVVAFQQAFLDNIRRNGRLNELELIAQFKLDVLFRTGRLAMMFKDATLGPQLGKRKKLHALGEKVRDRALVRRMFARCAPGAS